MSNEPKHKTAKRIAEGAAAILAMTIGGKVATEVELRDHIIRQALQLQQLVSGRSREADRIIVKLTADLKSLLNSRTLSAAGKREIQNLIGSATKAIDPAYGELSSVVDTHALSIIVADNTAAAIETVLQPGGAIATPTSERLASLTKDVLIDGAPSSAWWSKQGEDTAFKFAAAVRQGVVNGETNEKIVARVVSKDGSGILDVARRNARTLVHSSVMAAANDARLATFRKNARFVAGVRFLATLDSHVCIRCAALDGATWDLDGKPIGETKLEFTPPAIHFGCRCVLSPLPKLQFTGGERASARGPVSSTTTMTEFLKRNPDIAEEVLGKRRTELFLAGKLTLSDLVTGSGRELTLEQLAAH